MSGNHGLGGTENKYAVGDIESEEMGTAARSNGNKPNWALMPLEQIAIIEAWMPTIVAEVGEVKGFSTRSKQKLIDSLGDFQAGRCGAIQVLISSVVHLCSVMGFDEMKEDVENDYFVYQALNEVVRVWEFGAKEYAFFNWAKGADWSVPIGCLLRHILLYPVASNDEYSGHLHAAHAVCNAMMLCHYETYWKTGDDRPVKYFKDPDDLARPAPTCGQATLGGAKRVFHKTELEGLYYVE